MSTILDRALTERAWMRVVVEYAHLRGWGCYHTHDARHSVAGFPDLVLVRGTRLLFAELKRPGAHLTAAQTTWLADLGRVPGVAVAVWRPDDFEEVQRALA